MAHFIPEILEEFEGRTRRGQRVRIRRWCACASPQEGDANSVPERTCLLTVDGQEVIDHGDGTYSIKGRRSVRRPRSSL